MLVYKNFRDGYAYWITGHTIQKAKILPNFAIDMSTTKTVCLTEEYPGFMPELQVGLAAAKSLVEELAMQIAKTGTPLVQRPADSGATSENSSKQEMWAKKLEQAYHLPDKMKLFQRIANYAEQI